MTTILSWPQIAETLAEIDLIESMEQAFRYYSQGRAVIPPVGELSFEKPPGDVHIKYGFFKGGEAYVVKIASGFYENPALGLPSCQGLMLLFCQQTGEPLCILLDEGRLTDARTGAAGALAAKMFSRKTIEKIGIVGAGTQAREQARHLRKVTDCKQMLIWARDPAKALAMATDATALGFQSGIRTNLKELAAECDLIITTTPAKTPLLQADWIRAGTCIVAVGADTPEKQELDPHILAKADILVVDSLSQCRQRGEIHRAHSAGLIDFDRVVELGQVIDNAGMGRAFDDQIVVVDLTGVAVQDLAIASAVLRTWNHGRTT